MTEIDEPKVIDPPNKIYLVYGDLDEQCLHHECEDVSWCTTSQFPSDVRYIRSDAIDAEALAWAYQKLCAFGVGGGSNIDSAVYHTMMDRLREMVGIAA